MKYCKFAADQGYAWAEVEFGVCEMFGRAVKANPGMAAKRLESAAGHGDAAGANYFGLCLEFGKGIEMDDCRAVRYYQQAADKGHAEAQYHLGFCFEHGLGVDVNLDEAAKYYRFSADQGHVCGLRSYARFLHFGLAGDVDLEAAARYYEMAAHASDTSISAIEHSQFRCLRGLHRISLSNDQFSAFFVPKLKVLSECQSSRPVRSNMMSDFVMKHCPDVNLTEEIGRGASATVYLVRDSKRFGTFALKRFREGVYQSVYIAEFEILVKLNHPCILRIFKFVPPTKSSPAEIHMEWAQNGSLEVFLERVRRGEVPSLWNPTGIAIIIIGIVFGMRFMHSRGFIHQDLNPSNILLNAQGRALIADFGSSRSESVDITPTSSANDHYTAPEIHLEDDWGRKVDVYSFGLILYELLVGAPVFRQGEPPDDILEKKCLGFVPHMESRISPSMRNLIQACLRFDPESRPSFDDIFTTCTGSFFRIVSGADNRVVLNYVSALTEWELSHQIP
jgi:hypothetical protein